MTEVFLGYVTEVISGKGLGVGAEDASAWERTCSKVAARNRQLALVDKGGTWTGDEHGPGVCCPHLAGVNPGVEGPVVENPVYSGEGCCQPVLKPRTGLAG